MEENHTETVSPPPKERNPLKKLYRWTLRFAETKYAVLALSIVAITESIFFPVPPDAILIPLAIARPKKALFFCLVCSASSVLGGTIGYLIGFYLSDPVAIPLIRFFGLEAAFHQVKLEYTKHAALAVALSAFTPIPYKVFAIGAGICKISIVTFIVFSAIFRTARFLMLSLLCWKFGEKAKTFIEKHINWLTLLLAIIIIVIVLLLN
jgi:membrane protein YqaA with SNARE-associated domain